MNEERKKLIDNLEAWRDCTNTKCEDCKFSDPMSTKRTCMAMDVPELIELALKVVKSDMETTAVIEGGGPTWWFACEKCRGPIDPYDKYCKHCGRQVVRNG